MTTHRNFGPCPRCGALIQPMMGVPAINDADRPNFCSQCAAELRPPRSRVRIQHPTGDDADRPIPSSDAEFVIFLEDLAREHGVTPAAILRLMRDDAEKMIRRGSMILELVGRIEDRFRPR